MIPALEIKPLVGLIPKAELEAEGFLMELTVSDPVRVRVRVGVRVRIVYFCSV
jgi:hypothetical protein